MSDTREHIIQVAGRLFLQRNYDGVSIQDITKAVGMTKGALYHHFASKEQLFEEVAHDLLGKHDIDHSKLPGDSLRGFYTALVEQYRVREVVSRKAKASGLESGIHFHNLLWDAVRILPGFRASVQAIDALEHKAWKHALQAAIDRGEIRKGLDADKLARIFTSVPDGVSTASMLKGGPTSVQGEIQDLWDSLYQSLKP
jgi:TetR/AcrR family transcriptional regulator, transcriptional repressor for nem operon